MASIGIAGSGRMAQALGRLLAERGQPIAAIAGRDASRTSRAASFIGHHAQAAAVADLPAMASRILIAVPDDALVSVAATLAASATPPACVLHTSGAGGPEALAAIADRGTSCGAMHPLQTISTPEQGVADLPGSSFGITAEGPALDWALEICGALDGRPLLIPAELRPLYHAAAVMASNYIVAMVDAAATLMEQAGVAPEQALPALAPLIRASVENSLAAGPVQALTGPIERGDAETIASHLQALRGAPAVIEGLYRAAGLHTAALANRKFSATGRRNIESLLCDHKEGSKP